MPSGNMYQIEDIDDRLDDLGRDIWINVAVMGLRGTFAPSVIRLYRAVLFPSSPPEIQ
jgi:hypothetical protein